jgi:hypothetical protein
MKTLFGPTWRELIYEEARGVILANLLYWSSAPLQIIAKSKAKYGNT